MQACLYGCFIVSPISVFKCFCSGDEISEYLLVHKDFIFSSRMKLSLTGYEILG